MELEKSTEKLDKYYKRFRKGKAEKIKPAHVEKVIGRLRAKENMLRAELADTTKASKKTRLKRKIALVKEQLQRAKWLLAKVSSE